MATLYNSEIFPDKIDLQMQWSELPSIPLEKIYSFLRRTDQANMSLVCRNWSVGYCSPSVWRNFTFELWDWQLSTFTCPVMKFVVKYGYLFRYVKIHHRTSKNYIWCMHLIELLQHMTRNSQLISVKFHGLARCFAHIDPWTRKRVNRAIANFLGSQHQLKLEFEFCFFKFGECVRLLGKLNESSKDSIMLLRLGGLSICRPFEDQDSDIAQGLITLAGLKSVTRGLFIFEYSMIFKSKLACQSVASTTLQNPQNLALSKIIIDRVYASGNVRNDDGLKSINWRFLKGLYPDLQVEMTIKTASLLDLENLIVPGMPITLLNFTYEDTLDDYSLMELDDLLSHLLLCQANDYLVYLNLTWDQPIRNMASTFIPILQACKKLEYLDIFTVSPVNGLHLLMESWLKTRPQSLNQVNILIAGIKSKEDRTILINSTTDYVSRLQLVELNVKIDFPLESI